MGLLTDLQIWWLSKWATNPLDLTLYVTLSSCIPDIAMVILGSNHHVFCGNSPVNKHTSDTLVLNAVRLEVVGTDDRWLVKVITSKPQFPLCRYITLLRYLEKGDAFFLAGLRVAASKHGARPHGHYCKILLPFFNFLLFTYFSLQTCHTSLKLCDYYCFF